ncbi:hypothetical protein dqs_0626 [Azoarcus olearius]|uniref:hypothetical protein n=1 Tax=Azoarcus sp. (strain BH72) TaxID=418699 RepID=UPI00080615BC|nr:hypothetical protein [Azoarcus olearius]ANQ83702.1 hypothetical protein dqs_0626 [Azoarcus olearius]
MGAANARAGKAAKQVEARELPSATPAGEGFPGTNTASAEKADVTGAANAAPVTEADAREARQEPAPPAAGTIDPAAEAAAADVAAQAEAVTPAGGSVDSLVFDPLFREPVVTHLRVRARPEAGFRRAGRHWPGGEGVTVAADDFTPEQILALTEEPELAVTFIADQVAE